jgi:beta-galactosidase/beta-glucuronidase
VWTDNSLTTGWWYEGSGLPRHSRLVVTPSEARIRSFGIAAPAVVTGKVQTRTHTSDGLTADATVHPTADISVTSNVGVTVTFELVDTRSDVIVGKSTGHSSTKGDHTVAAPPISVANAELWSVPRPYLYTLVATLTTTDGSAVDTVNTSVSLKILNRIVFFLCPRCAVHVRT